MKRKLFLLILLVALTGIRCFALDATFLKTHDCVHIDEASHCTAHWGDTVSGFAYAFYGKVRPSEYEAIKEATPKIVDVKTIYMGQTIVIPDVPTVAAAVAASRVQPHAEKPTATATVNLVNLQQVPPTMTTTDPAPKFSAATFPEEMNIASLAVFQPTATPKVVLMQVATTQSVTPPPAPLPTSKVSGYQFAVSGSIQGSLQTQLILFNSEEEKRLGLPIERIDLKPSLAVPARDGNTAIFIHLKKIPAQPCVLLVGGVSTRIDCMQLQAYNGRFPGTHIGTKIMASIIKTGGPAGISFLAGGPIAAGIVVGVPRLIHLGIALHEKAQERRLAAAQRAVDKSKLALYRASLQSDALGNALPKKEL